MRWFLRFIFRIKLYMFRAVPLSIIMRSLLYTQRWYMSYRFADSLRTESGRSYVLILLASCQQKSMTYTIAVFTVKNSWWWIEELSETCRVLLYEENAKCNYYDIQYKDTNCFWMKKHIVKYYQLKKQCKYIQYKDINCFWMK